MGNDVLFCETKFFDLQTSWNTSEPDLTPCFQETALLWTPCVYLILLYPCRLLYLSGSDDVIAQNALNVTKTVLAVLLSFVSSAEVVKSALKLLSGESVPVVDLVSPSVMCFTMIAAANLIQHERRHGVKTSGFMCVFWFLLLISETLMFLSKLRAAIRTNNNHDQFRLVTCLSSLGIVLVEFVLTFFIDRDHNSKTKGSSPEQDASFLSKLMFSWFTEIIVKGYKEPLRQQDVFMLKEEDTSRVVIEKFDKYWMYEAKDKKYNGSKETNMTEKELTDKDIVDCKKRKPGLIRTIIRAFWRELLLSSILELIFACSIFIFPVFLKLMIQFVENKELLWRGYLYAVLMLCATVIKCLVEKHKHQIDSVLGMKARTAITSLVYRKVLVLSSRSRCSATAGEMVNMISVDAERFTDMLWDWNAIWSRPLEIGLSFYWLWLTLGSSALVGTIVLALVLPINGYLSKITTDLDNQLMELQDSRVKLMNEILNGIKVLKLYAWEKSFEQQVLDIRFKEFQLIKRINRLKAIMSFIWNIAPFLITVVTFAVYVLVNSSNTLDAEKIFVSLSLFQILRYNLGHLNTATSKLIPATVSLKRVQTFMENEELDPSSVTQHHEYKHAVSIEKGDFSWEDNSNLVLKNINLEIPEGSLVAVVGAVGSGKSSLLSAMLGEMNKDAGNVNLKGRVAYVSQQAWIQNQTLQNNVLFGSPYNKTLYDSVIEACALKIDLEFLPAGDNTDIGEKGINLSGGQKQRVSLARAVYQSADIYLLDDPLSAVDSFVGNHIFQQVIGPDSILKDKTRIMVTHGTSFLAKVDKIVVLVDGQISEIGSYQELMKQNGAFSDFLRNYAVDDDTSEEQEFDHLFEIPNKKEDPEPPDGCRHRFKKQISRSVSSTVDEEIEMLKRQKDHKLIEDESVETGKVGWSVYLLYLQSIGPRLLVFLVLNNLLVVGTFAYSNIWLSDWSSDDDPANNKWRLGVYGSIALVNGILLMSSEILKAVIAIKASAKLHDQVLRNVLRSPMSFFDSTPLGRIVNRFAKDVECIDDDLPGSLCTFIFAVLDFINTIGMIVYGQPLFIFFIIPTGLCFVVLQAYFIATSRQLSRLKSNARSPIASHFGETISGLSTIRAFNQQRRFIDESETRVENHYTIDYSDKVCDRWINIRFELLANVFVIFASVLLTVYCRDWLPAGLIGLALTFVLDIEFYLNWVVSLLVEMETNIVSVERIKEYIETPTEAAWEKEEADNNTDWPRHGNIEFRDYEARYKDDQDLVLNGISCKIEPGEKIGIVGRTGAGKSSLTMALFRIIEGASGSIIIDGVDIATLGLHDLRSKLTIIPQDPVLFSGTLRMNLDPFDAYTDDQIWESLEHAHLDKFVSGLKDGLQHKCTESGENISVGQRQLVCLARALLRKTKILILDEATAAVDLEMDELIQRTIKTEFKDCTIITIAHRLNTILDYTRIMMLDTGNVVEFDSPQILLQNKNSQFYKMAKDSGLVS